MGSYGAGSALPARAHRGVAHRLAIGLVDSGVSSAGNLGASIIAAKATSLHSFGVFATAMLVLILCTVASRSVHGDALILKSRGNEPETARDDARSSTASALRISLIVGTLSAGLCLLAQSIGAGWPREVVLTVLVSSAALPLLCLQDHLRWVDYARGKSKHALVNNALWAVCSIAGLLTASLVSGGNLSAQLCTAIWALSVLPGIGWAILHGRATPAWLGRARWLGGNALLVRPLFLDFALTQASAQGAVLAVAAFSSSSEIALIRKGQIWLGLATVVTTGLLSALQPMLVQRTATHGPASTVRFASIVGSVIGLLFLAYGTLLLLMPIPFAELIVGPGWVGVRPFLMPLTILAVGGVLGGCLGLALRTTGRIRRQVAWRALLAPTFLAAIAIAVAIEGALAGMWVLASGAVITALVWAVLLSDRWGTPETTP
jgi:O-antigen/teichoic acid export membrane protein